MNDNLTAPGISLEKTTSVINSDGGVLFQEGVILRKVSKFLIAQDEDGVIPIPVFFDPITKKILKSTVPPLLHEELKEHLVDA